MISIGDNIRPTEQQFTRVEFMSYRHGLPDPRFNLDSTISSPLPGNRSNILWGDAHVAAKGYYDLWLQPYGGDRCEHDGGGDWKPTNALTYGFTARQGVDISSALN